MDADASQRAAINILSIDGSFDQYCPACGEAATFRLRVDPEFVQAQNRLNAAATNISRPGGPTRHFYRDISKTAICTRAGHPAVYHFKIFDDGLIKIGQFPSMADFSIGDIQQYRKVLSKSDMKGLSTAMGLHAHGVGAGAFIYLRKIFESMVEEAHLEAQKDQGWDANAYRALNRMSDRIGALRHHLPEVLVENGVLYALLSEHVHNPADEETCLANFGVVLQGILAIADERLAKHQRASRLDNFNKSKAALLSGAQPAAKQSKLDG